MLQLLRNKKAQNTVEYAIMIAVVIGVFSAMQLYMRRGLSARVKGGMDMLPGKVLGQASTDGVPSDILGTDTEYEPYQTSNMLTTSSEGTERGTITQSGGVRELTNASTSRQGEQTIRGISGGSTGR